MPWFLDAIAGLILAGFFYVLVRLRMRYAPSIGRRFGQWARWTTWVIVGLLMVGIANLELFGLREILRERFGLESPFVHELLFALIAFGVGFWLVARHAGRNRDNADDSDHGGEARNCIGKRSDDVRTEVTTREDP